MAANIGPYAPPECLDCGSDHCEHAQEKKARRVMEFCRRQVAELERGYAVLAGDLEACEAVVATSSD